MREKLTHYIRAGYAGLYLVSHEEQRVEAELKAIAASLKHRLYAWSATAGLIDTSDGASRGAQDPMEVLGILAALPEDSIVLLRDYHVFLDDPNPMLLRQLKDQLRAGKTKGHTLALLGCRLKLPPELEREFIVVDFTLPGAEALNEVLSGIVKSTKKAKPSPEATASLIDAARGLTTTEAEDAFALSVVETGDLNPAVIAREKAQAVKKNGLLELIETRDPSIPSAAWTSSRTGCSNVGRHSRHAPSNMACRCRKASSCSASPAAANPSPRKPPPACSTSRCCVWMPGASSPGSWGSRNRTSAP